MKCVKKSFARKFTIIFRDLCLTGENIFRLCSMETRETFIQLPPLYLRYGGDV